jgi:hypothetical protein
MQQVQASFYPELALQFAGNTEPRSTPIGCGARRFAPILAADTEIRHSADLR